MLGLVSISVLAVMYAVLAVFLFLILVVLNFNTFFALIIAAGVTLLFSLFEYLLGPFFMDFQLRWLFRMHWIDRDKLPKHLADYLSELERKYNLRVVRIGLIDDFAPNAFTYGHYPGNARIVFTRGILEILDEEEQKAVLAHEVGHIVHWDFLFMMLANLVPMFMYLIYRTLSRSRRDSRRDKDSGYLFLLAIAAYITYIVSYYVVLWLSRIREFFADRFSAEVTYSPEALASALLKIAYGVVSYAGREDREYVIEEEEDYRSKAPDVYARYKPVEAMGIFDFKVAKAVAVGLSVVQLGTGYDRNLMMRVMQWDLFNPWAKLYELSSTHPLPARRIKALRDFARANNMSFSIELPEKPIVDEDEDRFMDVAPGFWDEFIVDLFFEKAPIIGALLLSLLLYPVTGFSWKLLGVLLIGLALGSLVKFWFAYRGTYREAKVKDLVTKINVSPIRGIPVILRGRVRGRAVAGYYLGDDLVLQDDTGFIILEYKELLSLEAALMALFKLSNFIDRDVTVKGYYRRKLVPVVEIVEMVSEDGKKVVPKFRLAWMLFIFLLLGLGAVLLLI